MASSDPRRIDPIGDPNTPHPSGAPAASDAAGGDVTVGATTAPVASAPGPTVRRTRTSTTHVAVTISLIVLVLVLILIFQNLHDTSIHFLGANGRLPVGLLVLAAAVAGGLIVLFVSLARLAQLRLVARRRRRASPT